MGIGVYAAELSHFWGRVNKFRHSVALVRKVYETSVRMKGNVYVIAEPSQTTIRQPGLSNRLGSPIQGRLEITADATVLRYTREEALEGAGTTHFDTRHSVEKVGDERSRAVTFCIN